MTQYSGIAQTECNNMISASLGIATYTAFNTTGGLGKIYLISGTAGANLSNSTDAAAGTEVTSYTRFSIPSTNFWGTVASGSVTNSGSSGAASYTSMPATSVYGIEIWDNSGTPVRKWWGSLSSSKTTNSGDTLSFAASSITVSMI